MATLSSRTCMHQGSNLENMNRDFLPELEVKGHRLQHK